MRTVLITGASSGFGKATAKLLSKHGFKLILIARRKKVLEKLKKDLKKNVYIAPIDITDRNQVKSLFENLPKEYQDIDVVINNAGLALGLETATDADLEDWEKMVDTNIKGLLYVTRFALEILKKKNKGLIINIGSILWVINQPQRVNIESIVMLPIDQTYGGLVINRK